MKETKELLEVFVKRNISYHNDIANLHTIFNAAINKVSNLMFFNDGYWFVHYVATTLEFYVSRSSVDEKEKSMETAKDISKKLLMVLEDENLDEKNMINVQAMTGAKIKEVLGIIKDIYETCQEIRKEIMIPTDDGTKIGLIIDDEFYLKLIVV